MKLEINKNLFLLYLIKKFTIKIIFGNLGRGLTLLSNFFNNPK